MICVKDAAMGVVHLSPEWLGFTGFGLSCSMGRGWLAAVHPDDRAMAHGIARRGGPARDAATAWTTGSCTGAAPAIWVSDAAVASFVPGERSFLGVLGAITEIPEGDRPAAARGRVGDFRPLPPMPSTATAAPRDLLADHLLLARGLARARRTAASSKPWTSPSTSPAAGSTARSTDTGSG